MKFGKCLLRLQELMCLPDEREIAFPISTLTNISLLECVGKIRNMWRHYRQLLRHLKKKKAEEALEALVKHVILHFMYGVQHCL